MSVHSNVAAVFLVVYLSISACFATTPAEEKAPPKITALQAHQEITHLKKTLSLPPEFRNDLERYFAAQSNQQKTFDKCFPYWTKLAEFANLNHGLADIWYFQFAGWSDGIQQLIQVLDKVQSCSKISNRDDFLKPQFGELVLQFASLEQIVGFTEPTAYAPSLAFPMDAIVKFKLAVSRNWQTVWGAYSTLIHSLYEKGSFAKETVSYNIVNSLPNRFIEAYKSYRILCESLKNIQSETVQIPLLMQLGKNCTDFSEYPTFQYCCPTSQLTKEITKWENSCHSFFSQLKNLANSREKQQEKAQTLLQTLTTHSIFKCFKSLDSTQSALQKLQELDNVLKQQGQNHWDQLRKDLQDWQNIHPILNLLDIAENKPLVRNVLYTYQKQPAPEPSSDKRQTQIDYTMDIKSLETIRTRENSMESFADGAFRFLLFGQKYDPHDDPLTAFQLKVIADLCLLTLYRKKDDSYSFMGVSTCPYGRYGPIYRCNNGDPEIPFNKDLASEMMDKKFTETAVKLLTGHDPVAFVKAWLKSLEETELEFHAWYPAYLKKALQRLRLVDLTQNPKSVFEFVLPFAAWAYYLNSPSHPDKDDSPMIYVLPGRGTPYYARLPDGTILMQKLQEFEADARANFIRPPVSVSKAKDVMMQEKTK